MLISYSKRTFYNHRSKKTKMWDTATFQRLVCKSHQKVINHDILITIGSLGQKKNPEHWEREYTMLPDRDFLLPTAHATHSSTYKRRLKIIVGKYSF